MKLYLCRLIVLICTITLIACSGRNVRKHCDPQKTGFFRNIGCINEWKRRQADKTNQLQELQSANNELKVENQRLYDKKRILLQEIRRLDEQSLVAQRYTEYLSKILSERKITNQEIYQLIEKIDIVLANIERIERMSPETWDYRYSTAPLKRDRNLLEKSKEFLIGYLKDDLIARGAKSLLPKVLKSIGSRLINIISIGKTIYDAIIIFGRD